MADTMVRSHQPRLQISKDEVNNRQILVGDLRIAASGDSKVVVSSFGEVSVATPVISDNLCAGHNRTLNEAAKRLCATVRDNGETNTTGIPPTFAFVEFGPRFSLYDLNGSSDNDFAVNAPAFPSGLSSDITFVDFNVLACFASYAILIWTHHASAELVENLESRLVTGNTQLPLKLHGRHARGLASQQIGAPKPDMQRRMRTFHYRSHRQSCVAPALAASKYTGAIWKSKRIARRCTIRADKPVAPTKFLQINCTGFIVGKKPLKLRKGLGERKVIVLMNTHDWVSYPRFMRATTG
jgi:hypothetical protein